MNLQYKNSHPVTLHFDLPDSYCTVRIHVPQTDPTPSNTEQNRWVSLDHRHPQWQKAASLDTFSPTLSLRPIVSRRLLEEIHGYDFDSSLKPIWQLTSTGLEENILRWFKRNAKACFAIERNNAEQRQRSLVTGQYIPKPLSLTQEHRLIRTR